jgi:3-oxoacyl-[acyl-carrier protein] reductase
MKNILIAGAGKGIGLATATQICQQANLFTISRNLTEPLAALNTKFYKLDLSSDSLDALNDLPDTLHGLVYCPGSINLKPFNRLTAQDFLNDFQQNIVSAVNLIQKVLPALKKAEGASIVLYSTVAVKAGMPFHASIAAAKGAVEGLSRSLAAEFAASRIRVNVVAPSLTDTPLASALLNTPEKKEAAGKRHPLQRVGTAEDMAKLTNFLLSDDSGWITGQVIGADGGLGSLRV